MYILGLNSCASWTHDPSACLVKDGVLVAAAEEERFTRKRHAKGVFPFNSIKFCLDFAGISLAEIDFIAVGWQKPVGQLIDVPLNYALNVRTFGHLRYAYNNSKNVVRFFLRDGIKKEVNSIGGFKGQIKYIPHHLSHSSSAFRVSGFKESLILSMDNHGESSATFLGYSDGNEIQSMEEIKFFNSLGLFYGAFTEFLGFKMGYNEGKTMGMAPYGKPVIDLKEFIEVNESGYQLNTKNYYGKSHYTEKFNEKFGPTRLPEASIKGYEDIAASVQKKLEQAAINLTKKLFDTYGCSNISIAGGVGLNCVMNGRILSKDYIKNIFVQPASNDAGTAIGAAMQLYFELGGKKKFEMTNAYLGPKYSNEEIKRELKNAGMEFEFHSDIAGVSAELLAKGFIGGWFQDRMELGARALGNRSILADPRKKEMWKKVNEKVKRRELWRPFAPSILEKSKEEYLEGAYKSPFMTLSFLVKEEKQKEIPAVVHVDGSTRPQTVEKKENPLYYKLIKDFESISGVPVVLNTSFNVRGEPIVCRPSEAINDFKKTGMDFLAIGNYLLKK